MRLIILSIFSLVFSVQVWAQSEWGTVKGLRVDPGRLYDTYPGVATREVAKRVSATAQAAGFNTLFVYAYNSVYGAFYPTTYSMTAVEGGYGVDNFLSAVTTEAHARGLRVVAVVPVNDFKKVWQTQNGWRMKKKTGYDYRPTADNYLLSAWQTPYRNWYQGFLGDLISRNPGIDGVEGVEPFIDYNWNRASDYNPAANNKFFSLFPSGALGDINWRKLRAQGLTELQGILNSVAHAYLKKSFVVQTWTSASNGTLFRADDIRDGMGFDFNGTFNLSGASKTDFVMGEFMWQQWKADYGSTFFTPAWTSSAASQFVTAAAGRSVPLIHVELSGSDVGWEDMTLAQFQQTISEARKAGGGVDVYDFSLLEARGAWAAARAALVP